MIKLTVGDVVDACGEVAKSIEVTRAALRIIEKSPPDLKAFDYTID